MMVHDAGCEGHQILAPLRERVIPRWRDGWLGSDIEGWYPLLARLAEDLTTIAPTWTLIRVRAKFGMLDFSAAHGTYDVEARAVFAARVRQAEVESTRTCDICGRHGVLARARHHEVRVLCDQDRDWLSDHVGERFEVASELRRSDGGEPPMPFDDLRSDLDEGSESLDARRLPNWEWGLTTDGSWSPLRYSRAMQLGRGEDLTSRPKEHPEGGPD